jgi:hypothetical protein
MVSAFIAVATAMGLSFAVTVSTGIECKLAFYRTTEDVTQYERSPDKYTLVRRSAGGIEQLLYVESNPIVNIPCSEVTSVAVTRDPGGQIGRDRSRTQDTSFWVAFDLTVGSGRLLTSRLAGEESQRLEVRIGDDHFAFVVIRGPFKSLRFSTVFDASERPRLERLLAPFGERVKWPRD